jgi:hypothetical protein
MHTHAHMHAYTHARTRTRPDARTQVPEIDAWLVRASANAQRADEASRRARFTLVRYFPR